jgi:hypothetical protein
MLADIIDITYAATSLAIDDYAIAITPLRH